MCEYCENPIDIYRTDEMSFIAYYPFHEEESEETDGAHLFKIINVDPSATVCIDWYEWDNGDETVITNCPVCERELYD